MRKKWLLIFAVTSTCFALPISDCLKKQESNKEEQLPIDEITTTVGLKYGYIKPSMPPFDEIKKMLVNTGTLQHDVINKVLMTLKCSHTYHVKHNNILTIIDYSLPSSEKRLWVFDLNTRTLLFHTYVSHGIKSGDLFTNYFSNKHDSKATSMGVYKTEQTYYGRDGLSLRLAGLESGFNDNASSRYVVMHGGWYVDEAFIKKYGRAGRSWGCPALPQNLTQPIIETIKDDTIFVVYYPSDRWFSTSKFLNCHVFPPLKKGGKPAPEPSPNSEAREAILFADMNKNNGREENEAVVVMSADDYTRILQTKAPVERMLRRQINQTEYIALSNDEFKRVATSPTKEDLNTIYFVIPVIKMVRGYYATEMHFVPYGKIKEVKLNTSGANALSPGSIHTVNFEAKPPITIRATNRFIRWLGL